MVLCALPMFHVTGMQAGMNAPLCIAARRIVVLPRWDRDCAGDADRARDGSPTGRRSPRWWSTSCPTPSSTSYDLSSLRVLGGGGAAMPEALARKLEEVIGLPFVEGYGLSETMAPTHINPPQRPKRQCLGIPFFNTDSRVVDPETLRGARRRTRSARSSCTARRCSRATGSSPRRRAQAFIEHDGKRFFRTGDLGYYDEEGYFFITDRLKRMINCSGFKVWPAEVEAMLYAHPAIQEACVIGARDAYRGETVKAVVVLKSAVEGHVDPQDIIDWARENMAAFKVPRMVEFVDELPKTATGKILWRKLQEEENRKDHEIHRTGIDAVRPVLRSVAECEVRRRLDARHAARREGGRRLHDRSATVGRSPTGCVGALLAGGGAASRRTSQHARTATSCACARSKGYGMPAKGSFELKPNGAHLMLVDLKRPLKEGEQVPVVLRFEKAGEVKVELRGAARWARRHQPPLQH